MSVTSIDGKTFDMDRRHDRIGAGTIGGEHVQARTLRQQHNAVVDDADRAIEYGSLDASGSFTTYTLLGTTQQGTQTIIGGVVTDGNEQSAAGYKFKGTNIGVLGGMNPE